MASAFIDPVEPPPLVRVEWEDAACLDDTHWVTNEDPPVTYKPVLVVTVGFLLLNTRAVVIVTDSWSPIFTGPRDQIPRGMIRKLEYLKPAPAPKLKGTKSR